VVRFDYVAAMPPADLSGVTVEQVQAKLQALPASQRAELLADLHEEREKAAAHNEVVTTALNIATAVLKAVV